VTEVVLKIIEEMSDGFLIINHEGRVRFFNEMLRKTTGLRSNDILSREMEFLAALGANGSGAPCVREAVINDRDGVPHRFVTSAIPVDSGRGTHFDPESIEDILNPSRRA
jgi:PAS domain-containing protein